MPDPTLASRVHDTAAGPARLLLLPTGVRDVVSFRGSFESGPDLGAADDLVQSLMTQALDKGTRRRGRFEIAEDLEGRGAQVAFYSDGLRVGFSGRALRDDLAHVLGVVAEELREPALSDDEVEKAVRRATASVRRSRESTGTQASGTLARRLFGPAHPDYVLDPDDEMARLEALRPDDVRAYHAAHVGSTGLTLAVVGDLDVAAAEAAAGAAFDDWARTASAPTFEDTARPAQPGRTDVEMADRRNLDVRLGHAVALRRDDPDFLATYAGVFALGGNFSGRLMQTVRDEQGLTYGVSASLGSVSTRHDGRVYVAVTLSQENLDRGIAATRAEVEGFVADGLTEEALAQTRTTLAGQHVVSLATTGGVAARLLVNAERGFDVDYLDRYPTLVSALTVGEVDAAVRRHLRPSDLHVVVAGTLPDGTLGKTPAGV
ncbi:pitrilysin family protein [Rubrivirga sp. S365]|uniref:Pitrilysin family protein n=1 Tax=Rubrivirga litoralis TaxID=3075598 RepID=A0ABU3BN02_9BACT|nr:MULTISPECIES: pitrilysin family protein [unclassified Rubrivirga]MDT0630606.1 pitrilysin family protein [Rubrivirga sp. F394]MDT7857681.1 pitrilysin family protein [Rubrivirga sp. S365]